MQPLRDGIETPSALCAIAAAVGLAWAMLGRATLGREVIVGMALYACAGASRGFYAQTCNRVDRKLFKVEQL